MSYHLPPEPPADPHYDVTELTRLLDDLIVSFEEYTTAQRALQEWDEEHEGGPQQPQSYFEGPNELVEYLQAQRAYLRDRAVLVQQQDDSRRDYKAKGDEVSGWLPQGSSLTHEYRGQRYEIVHRAAATEEPVVVFKRD